MPVEINPLSASSRTSRMSFYDQGDGNRSEIALMGLLEKCSVSSRQRAGWCCPRGFVMQASRAPLRLIPRISLFSFLPEGLKSQDNSGCSFTGVRTLRNQGGGWDFGEQFGN